jgi:hypothetical protein
VYVGVLVLVNVGVFACVFVLVGVGEIITNATQLDDPLSACATFKTPVEVGDGVGVLVLVGVTLGECVLVKVPEGVGDLVKVGEKVHVLVTVKVADIVGVRVNVPVLLLVGVIVGV